MPLETPAESQVGGVKQNPGAGYSVAVIRDLLRASFTPEELLRFCYDNEKFRYVYDEVPRPVSLNTLVDHLVEHCEKKMLFKELLAWVQEKNPGQYKRFEPQLYAAPSASALPSREESSPRSSLSDTQASHSPPPESRASEQPGREEATTSRQTPIEGRDASPKLGPSAALNPLEKLRSWIEAKLRKYWMLAAIALLFSVLGTVAGWYNSLTGRPFIDLLARATQTHSPTWKMEQAGTPATATRALEPAGNPSSTFTPTSTSTPTPTLTPTPTVPPPPCPRVEVSPCLELVLITAGDAESENLQLICPDEITKTIALSEAQVGNMPELQGRAIVTGVNSCTCDWMVLRAAQAATPMPAASELGDCWFAFDRAGQSSFTLYLTVGERKEHFVIKIE